MYDLNTIINMNKPKEKKQTQNEFVNNSEGSKTVRHYEKKPKTYTVTIGGNIGLDPMPDHKWKGFKSALNSFVDSHIINTKTDEIYVQSEGFCKWTDENKNTIVEKNYTVVFSSCKPINLKRLKRLARLFRQDAISLTTGKTNLVKG